MFLVNRLKICHDEYKLLKVNKLFEPVPLKFFHEPLTCYAVHVGWANIVCLISVVICSTDYPSCDKICLLQNSPSIVDMLFSAFFLSSYRMHSGSHLVAGLMMHFCSISSIVWVMIFNEEFQLCGQNIHRDYLQRDGQLDDNGCLILCPKILDVILVLWHEKLSNSGLSLSMLFLIWNACTIPNTEHR